MRRLVPALGSIAVVAFFSACGGRAVDFAVTERDAAPAPREPTADATPEDTDATSTRDARAADSGLDATPDSRADADRDDRDATADADSSTTTDGGGDATTTELAEIPGLSDFDFDGDTLVYRRAGVDLFTCTMPGCTGGPRLGAAWITGHFSLSQGNVYFAGFGGLPGSLALYSTTLSGTPPTLLRAGAFARTDVFNVFGGETNVVASADDLRSPPETWVVPAPRTGTIATPTRYRHENLGAEVWYEQSSSSAIKVSEVTVPTEFSSAAVATSPRVVGGVPLPHPAVAVITNAATAAICPTRVSCTQWVRLQNRGVITTVVGFDATHFYLGDPLGLRRCPLAEIDTLRTCTFTDLVAEPVDYPFYVVPNANGNATAIWYRSGDRVRKLVLP